MLSLRSVVLIVVGKVVLELRVLQADLIILLLDRILRVLLDRQAVGLLVQDELAEAQLTFFLP